MSDNYYPDYMTMMGKENVKWKNYFVSGKVSYHLNHYCPDCTGHEITSEINYGIQITAPSAVEARKGWLERLRNDLGRSGEITNLKSVGKPMVQRYGLKSLGHNMVRSWVFNEK